jgi:hypothetical protein
MEVHKFNQIYVLDLEDLTKLVIYICKAGYARLQFSRNVLLAIGK